MFDRIACALAGSLLVAGSAVAQEKILGTMTTVPNVPVVVNNTTANPVPTTAQGTTQVAGSVSVTGSVSIAGTPNVSIAGTPTLNVAGLQFDGSGNLKVTGGGSGAPPPGRLITLVDPNGPPVTVAPSSQAVFPSTDVDTSDCRSLWVFQSEQGLSDTLLIVSIANAFYGGVSATPLLGSLDAAGFLLRGTSTPVVAPSVRIAALTNGNGPGTVSALYLYCAH